MFIRLSQLYGIKRKWRYEVWHANHWREIYQIMHFGIKRTRLRLANGGIIDVPTDTWIWMEEKPERPIAKRIQRSMNYD